MIKAWFVKECLAFNSHLPVWTPLLFVVWRIVLYDIARGLSLLLPLTEHATFLTPSFSQAIRMAMLSFVGLFIDLVDIILQYHLDLMILLPSILRPIVLPTTNFCLSIVSRIILEFIGLKEAPKFTFLIDSGHFEHNPRTQILLQNSVKSWLFNNDLALLSAEYEPETSDTSLSYNYEKSKELPWSIKHWMIKPLLKTNVIERSSRKKRFADLITRRFGHCGLRPKMVLN